LRSDFRHRFVAADLPNEGINAVRVLLQMNWPFWRISNHSDLAALHHALDLNYL